MLASSLALNGYSLSGCVDGGPPGGCAGEENPGASCSLQRVTRVFLWTLLEWIFGDEFMHLPQHKAVSGTPQGFDPQPWLHMAGLLRRKRRSGGRLCGTAC